MAFLGSFGQFFSNPGKTISNIVNKVVDNPLRATLGVLTGGVSELARNLPIVGKTIAEGQDIYFKAQTGFANAISGGLFSQAQGIVQNLNNQRIGATLGPEIPYTDAQYATYAPQYQQGGQPMAFDIGGLIGGLGSIFGGSGNAYVGGAGQIAQAFGSSLQQQQRAAPPPPAIMQAYTPQFQLPAVIPVANVPARVSSGVGLTQDVFNAGQKVLSRLGIDYSASPTGFSKALKRALGTVGALARRTPAGTIVTVLGSLGLAAQEAYILAAWQSRKSQRRAMNPCNPKALRKAARRIRGFHKMCQKLDLLKTRHSSKPAYRPFAKRKR